MSEHVTGQDIIDGCVGPEDVTPSGVCLEIGDRLLFKSQPWRWWPPRYLLHPIRLARRLWWCLKNRRWNDPPVANGIYRVTSIQTNVIHIDEEIVKLEPDGFVRGKRT